MTRRVFPPGLPGGLPTGLVEDALRSLVGAVKEAVPLDAQLHLLAAQRELILAVASVIEHRGQGPAGEGGEEATTSTPAGRRKAGGAPPGGTRTAGGRRAPGRSGRPTRVSLD